jgi:hypothetical protein
VIKVFENFDFSRVGQMQSVLESNGIRTFIRNQYGSSVMGEVPFIEVVPQLFVLEDRDAPRARELLRDLEEPPADVRGDWTCAKCGTGVEGNFESCWQCGAARPEA